MANYWHHVQRTLDLCNSDPQKAEGQTNLHLNDVCRATVDFNAAAEAHSNSSESFILTAADW